MVALGNGVFHQHLASEQNDCSRVRFHGHLGSENDCIAGAYK